MDSKAKAKNLGKPEEQFIDRLVEIMLMQIEAQKDKPLVVPEMN